MYWLNGLADQPFAQKITCLQAMPNDSRTGFLVRQGCAYTLQVSYPEKLYAKVYCRTRCQHLCVCASDVRNHLGALLFLGDYDIKIQLNFQTRFSQNVSRSNFEFDHIESGFANIDAIFPSKTFSSNSVNRDSTSCALSVGSDIPLILSDSSRSSNHSGRDFVKNYGRVTNLLAVVTILSEFEAPT